MIAVAVAGLLLSGCSDMGWDGAMSYVGLGPSDQPAQAEPATAEAAPAMPAQTNPADTWCRTVATRDAQTAARNGFDAATQERVAATSYRQCIQIPAGASVR